MKPAVARSPVGRSALCERQKRDRAVAPVINSRFPRLATVQLAFEYSDRPGFIPSPQTIVLHPPARAFFRFACPYADCDGEFDLTGTVALLASSRDRRAEGQLICVGKRHGSAQCTLTASYSIITRWL